MYDPAIGWALELELRKFDPHQLRDLLGRWARMRGNRLGVPHAQHAGLFSVASDFVGGPDGGVGFSIQADLGEHELYTTLTAGTKRQVVRRLDGDDVAFFGTDESKRLHKAIADATDAAKAGRRQGPTRIVGDDLGDVDIESTGSHVRIRVVPYGAEDTYAEYQGEPFHYDPLTEVEGDDGPPRPPTAEEIANDRAEQKAEYDADVAAYEKERQARLDSLTADLTVEQAQALIAGMSHETLLSTDEAARGWTQFYLDSWRAFRSADVQTATRSHHIEARDNSFTAIRAELMPDLHSPGE